MLNQVSSRLRSDLQIAKRYRRWVFYVVARSSQNLKSWKETNEARRGVPDNVFLVRKQKSSKSSKKNLKNQEIWFFRFPNKIKKKKHWFEIQRYEGDRDVEIFK